MTNVMAVTNRANATTNSASTPVTNSMGENAFLNLLITQMQNQDPLNPMDDQQFVSELAQFSSLEQMTQLNQQFGTLAQQNQNILAASYLGKTVTYQDPSTTTPVTGAVTAIDYVSGSPMLSIGGKDIDPSWVTKIATS